MVWLLWLFLVCPLGYFFLYRPFDRRFKRIGIETIERGGPYGPGIRTLGYAADIVLEPWRGKKIKNRALARYVNGRFQYQARMFGSVNFRKAATRFQIGVAYFITYGMVYFFLSGVLFALLYLPYMTLCSFENLRRPDGDRKGSQSRDLST